MNVMYGVTHSAAAAAFDHIAGRYDETFTRTAIGRAQRKQVWRCLLTAFPPGSRVLELNCGTGEDARFLVERGRSVLACDASAAMIEIARRRYRENSSRGNIEYLQLANEDLGFLPSTKPFDGAFSNFSGLNCSADLRPIARDLAGLVKPRRRVLICLWGRVCVVEMFWYLLHGQPRKVFRRLSGKATAKLGGMAIPVTYPSVRKMCRAFSPWFRLVSRRAIGLFVPPSYVEHSIRDRENLVARLESLDQRFAQWPILRDVGDHMLLEFVRCNL